MSDRLSVEATGETVAEAKVHALQVLERLDPRFDRESVEYQVVHEGKRGLLGVGFIPASVVATAARGAAAAAGDESNLAARLRSIVEQVTIGLGLPSQVTVSETDERIEVTCEGPDLGLLIGRHGQTIDAVQTLVGAIAARGVAEDQRREIVVDASGYRDRRRRTLESLALDAAADALRAGGPIELEPMSAPERKLVHMVLADREDVRTTSEGDEPNRRVVVLPA